MHDRIYIEETPEIPKVTFASTLAHLFNNLPSLNLHDPTSKEMYINAQIDLIKSQKT